MRMLQARTGFRAVVLEDQPVAKTRIARKIEHAIAIRPQHLFDFAQLHVGERELVVGRFDNDLVRADPVH